MTSSLNGHLGADAPGAVKRVGNADLCPFRFTQLTETYCARPADFRPFGGSIEQQRAFKQHFVRFFRRVLHRGPLSKGRLHGPGQPTIIAGLFFLSRFAFRFSINVFWGAFLADRFVSWALDMDMSSCLAEWKTPAKCRVTFHEVIGNRVT
jgi:hypothetical protein